MELFDWFKGFEKGIARLPKNQRAALFSECSKQCVKSGTLEIYKELYKRADGDLDKFFLKADELPGVKCEIVAKGSVYHLYFTECTCKLHMEGYIHPLNFANVPGKASFISCICYGKTGHSG